MARHRQQGQGVVMVLRALGAALIILALLVGIPAALLALSGNPIPDALPSFDEITDAVTQQDMDGSLFLDALSYIAWIGWATFAVSVLLEIPAAVRGRPATRIPGLGLQQRTAAGLISVIVAGLGFAPTGAAFASEAEAAQSTVDTVATSTASTSVVATAASALASGVESSADPAKDADETTEATSSAEPSEPMTYVVKSGDSLWKIADNELGDGARWPEIAELNYGVPQPGWKVGLDRSHWIDPGWTLMLPTTNDVDESATEVEQVSSSAESDAVHVVQRGDTLWDMAADALGPDATNAEIASAWPELYAANRSVIGDDPDLIHPGQTLHYPSSLVAAPADEAGTSADEPADGPDEEPDEPADEPADASDEEPDDTEAAALDSPADDEPDRDQDDVPDSEPDEDEEDAGDEGAAGAAEPPAAEEPEPEPETEPESEPSEPAAGVDEPPAGDGQELPAEDGSGDDPSAERDPGAEAAEDPPDDVRAGSVSEDDQVIVDFPLRTVAGVGGLLAAALIALFATNRRRQNRKRRAGQKVQMPTGAAAEAEQAMREVADPMGVEIVDRALRTLAVAAEETGTPPPPVRAARLVGAEFELYLNEPSQLPAPWYGNSDGTAWKLPADVDTSLLLDTEQVREAPAPYPGLVTVGNDPEGGHVLLDLEFLGALNVHGVEEHARQVVAALAVELAVTGWADDLSVAVVGVCPELEQALGTGRLRYFDNPDELIHVLETHARNDRQVLTDAGVGAAARARANGPGVGEWAPEIVLIGVPVTPEHHQRLSTLVHDLPRVAIAVVTTGAEPISEWTVRIDNDPDQAVIEPLGLPIAPQRLNDEEYSAILAILDAGDSAPAGEPFANGSVDQTSDTAAPGALGDLAAAVPMPGNGVASPVSSPASHNGTDDTTASDADSMPPVSDADAVPSSADTVAASTGTENGTGDDTSPMMPEVDGSEQYADDMPTGTGASVHELLSHTNIDSNGLLNTTVGATDPFIWVLGPVKVDSATGTVDSRHVGQLTEIAAYLALHPGASSEDLDQAIWPGEPNKRASRTQACSRLRNWLGDDADGNRYFPQMTGGRYEFSDAVRTDWELFCELVPTDPRTVSTENLEAALALVTGPPFTGSIGRRPKYRWADRLKQEMITTIADAAAVVAQRALSMGEPQRARAAAATGLQVEPGMEELWRYLFTAEYQTGNVPALHEAADNLALLLEELGDDPEPETAELLEQLVGAGTADHPRPPRQVSLADSG